jgi:hypothetical protein
MKLSKFYSQVSKLTIFFISLSTLGCTISVSAEMNQPTPCAASLSAVASVLNAQIRILSEDTQANESELDRQVWRVLDDQTVSGSEALALLLGFYIGESVGENIACELVRRGKSVIPMLHYYSSHEVNIPHVQMPLIRRTAEEYSIVEQRIAKGEHCVVEK